MKVLRAENASSRVCGMFYKATVQAVLLFGSETWCMSTVALKSLEGFHLQAAYRMAYVNKPRQGPNQTWKYPESAATLEEVRLYPIAYYVQVRGQTITCFIVNRPIFVYCTGGERKRGTSPHQWWWEQPMDLDAARVEAATADSGVDANGETWVVDTE